MPRSGTLTEQRQKQQEYRRRRLGIIRQQKREYYHKHRETILVRQRQYTRKWRDAKRQNPIAYRQYLDQRNEYQRARKAKILACPIRVAAVRETMRRYREQNIDKLRILNRDWWRKNRRRIYLAARHDPVKLAKMRADWNKQRLRYKERINSYQRQRRKKDPSFRLADCIRRRLNSVLFGRNKSASSMVLIGCSKDEFKAHIERQFKDGMTWENHGKFKGQWALDHQIPCAAFNLAKPEEQLKCFHFSNYRPLWVSDNASKGPVFNGHRWKHGDHHNAEVSTLAL